MKRVKSLPHGASERQGASPQNRPGPKLPSASAQFSRLRLLSRDASSIIRHAASNASVSVVELANPPRYDNVVSVVPTGSDRAILVSRKSELTA